MTQHAPEVSDLAIQQESEICMFQALHLTVWTKPANVYCPKVLLNDQSATMFARLRSIRNDMNHQ